MVPHWVTSVSRVHRGQPDFIVNARISFRVFTRAAADPGWELGSM